MGRAIDSGDDLQSAPGAFAGNERAKSALDLAWWNLAATLRGVPLHRLLGAERNIVALSRRVACGLSIDELIAQVGAAYAAPCAAVVLEMRPGWDVEMLRAVRSQYGSQPLAVDCDASYTLSAEEMFYRLEDFFLDAIEQPLAADDLVGHAMLQESLRTPLSLHQTITSLERAEHAIDLGACRRVKIELAPVGGLTPAVAIGKACQQASISWSVNVPPQRLTAKAALALATTAPGELAAEFSRLEPPRFLTNPWPFADQDVFGGTVTLDESPGGVSVDRNSLLDAAIEHGAIS